MDKNISSVYSIYSGEGRRIVKKMNRKIKDTITQGILKLLDEEVE